MNKIKNYENEFSMPEYRNNGVYHVEAQGNEHIQADIPSLKFKDYIDGLVVDTSINHQEIFPEVNTNKKVISLTKYHEKSDFAHVKKLDNLLYGHTATIGELSKPHGGDCSDCYMLTKADKN